LAVSAACARRPASTCNVGTHEDADVLTRALNDAEPLVREHAAWALAQLVARQGE
jgi:epoxyqueuosine reductase